MHREHAIIARRQRGEDILRKIGAAPRLDLGGQSPPCFGAAEVMSKTLGVARRTELIQQLVDQRQQMLSRQVVDRFQEGGFSSEAPYGDLVLVVDLRTPRVIGELPVDLGDRSRGQSHAGEGRLHDRALARVERDPGHVIREHRCATLDESCQQRGFPCAVAADDTEHLSFRNLKRDVPECPDFPRRLVVLPACEAFSGVHQRLAQRPVGGVVLADSVLLRKGVDLDRDRHQIVSAKRGSAERKTASPTRKRTSATETPTAT